VLVVVHHRDFHSLFQTAFDLETFRCLDVFEVYSPKAWLQGGNGIHKRVNALPTNFQIHAVHAGKPLKQDGFPLHHRFGRLGTDVSETQHRRTDGNNVNHVCPGGLFKTLDRVGGDLAARLCHTRGIRQGQIVLGRQRLGRGDLKFARGALPVISKCVVS
jgi:hypothetical protein